MVDSPRSQTKEYASVSVRDVQPSQSTILVIDDESSIRSLLRIILEAEGYRVLAAANGVEALKMLLSTQPPDLILLDMMMPVMNGWDFIDVLKSDERLREIPTVLMTAYSRSEIQLPEFDLIKKPFDFPTLRRTVAKFCGPGIL